MLGPIYFDASALAKLFIGEAESRPLEAAVEGRSDLLISELALTEVTSVVGRRCRETGDYSSAAVVWGKMLEQARWGKLGILDLVPAVHREAERLLLRPDGPPLRAADALHLALARSGGAATFACYDQRLRAAASQLGLLLYPPATG